MKRRTVSFLLAAVFVFLAVSIACAQESITITTYYPSPYGVYKQLRLSPTDDFTPYAVCTNEGEMYYDASANALYVCSSNPSGIPSGRVWRLAPGAGALWSLNATTNAIYNTDNRSVGIGTSAPGALLEIYSVNADAPAMFSDLPLVGAKIAYSVGIDNSAATSFNINRGTTLGASVDFVLDTSGRIGIGRYSTANKLEVEGTTSNSGGGLWLTNSDLRLKTDVQNIANPLTMIKKLRPVKFRYTQEYRTKHPSVTDKYYYNFIAQEFRNVFPENVQDGGDGYLQLDASSVIPLSVAAVQELNKIVDKQGQEIEALKKEIANLKLKVK